MYSSSENAIVRTLVASFILLSSLLVLLGCTLAPANEDSTMGITRSCVIDLQALPQGWIISDGPNTNSFPDEILPGRAEHGAGISFLHPESGARAYHQVLLYQNEERAGTEYIRQQPMLYYNSGRLSPWIVPTIDYEGNSADESRLACSNFEGIKDNQQNRHCKSIGRYAKFLSLFSTWMSPEYMSDSELVHVIEEIDERMTTCTDSFSD